MDLVTERKNTNALVKKNKKKSKTIQAYKLRDKETQKLYQEKVDENIDAHQENTRESEELEQMWTCFKNSILTAAETTCGLSVKGVKKKFTHWWTEEVKRIVKDKKIAWKKYLTTKSQTDYEMYKEKRTAAKNAVLMAKSKSWKEFGEKWKGPTKIIENCFTE
uniref:Uncharacterized protein n=1 Tax=Cacopsylla melanoneura TaxID=428564 RepID=A0A8D8XC74_9HEMI